MSLSLIIFYLCDNFVHIIIPRNFLTWKMNAIIIYTFYIEREGLNNLRPSFPFDLAIYTKDIRVAAIVDVVHKSKNPSLGIKEREREFRSK